MSRRTLATALGATIALGLASPVPAQEIGSPFVTINAAPDAAAVAAGEHIGGTEMTNTPPMAGGPTGPAAVFVADDGFGCAWTTATASGAESWIGVARRGQTAAEGTDQCPGFQTKITTAQAAGAAGLIVVNHSPGHEAGTAAGDIPALMIDKGDGDRLIESLDPAAPDAVKVTLESLDPNTFEPPLPYTPTRITSLDAAASGDALQVTGRAIFNGEGPVRVAEDIAGDGPLHPERASEAGVDIVGAYISQPDPNDPRLLFEWEVTELPASGSLPELVRYGFPFKAETAGFMAQAKFSNVASGTLQDDPQGHVEHAAGTAFQLRGGCAPDDAGVIACGHVEWLTGAFDTVSDRVKIYVPIGGPNTPTIQPGVEIVSNPDSLGGNPTASFQAYVSNNTTEDEAFWDPSATYTVPERTVRMGLVPTGAAPAYSVTASVATNGTFDGALDVAGKSGEFDLVVEACFGTNCATSVQPVTL